MMVSPGQQAPTCEPSAGHVSNNHKLDQVEQQIRDALDAGDADEALRLGTILDEADWERAVRLSSDDALASAALWYAEQGVAVFPLQPRGKLPITSHGFKDATADPEQVRAWWRTNPQANIGLPTGRRFDVIDIDGADGAISITQCSHDPECRDGNHRGRIGELDDRILGHATTARPGGRHLYVPATGHGNRAGIYPGIDYRGVGGYVVAPPSVGANEKPYRWTRHLDLERAVERA